MYVLDTNTLIYYFKGQGQVAQNFIKVAPEEIGIPTIVLFELLTLTSGERSPTQKLFLNAKQTLPNSLQNLLE
jgi:tRNA(fMet)-specific endonuclease VapC